MADIITDISSIPVETHPWEPFMPSGAKVLIMGTFPPKPTRWSMDFYYPNFINDFWRITGLLFFNDPMHFVIPGKKSFDLPAIKAFLNERGIALHDSCHRIRRLRDNASDKYLDVVEPVDLPSLLTAIPECHVLATTGERAAQVIAGLTDTEVPCMGYMTVADYQPSAWSEPRRINIWRMPSTSRAYPLPLTAKADHYRRLFQDAALQMQP